ncbi:hypothetical protein ACSVUS_003701 [Vibrio alginolyticus]|nr:MULTISPECIES: hypothetical protein [Vibrio harveyi group]CAH0528313.1 hypothetical protein CTH30272_01988 [Catenococcus thiocycli]EHK1074250.1 hypothetical protein [Vibrio parahaemolyticus]EIU6819599.1 hypothetical protein [Vibrio parahaemolyticus]MBE4040015.1 hypothetical protein [Vibrio parahaemolyticus]MBM4876546.1 hypothetical protein [Vibrio parahaemolyticus]
MDESLLNVFTLGAGFGGVIGLVIGMVFGLVVGTYEWVREKHGRKG